MQTRVLTGITTTGTPHLGNYVGAIRPKRDMIWVAAAGPLSNFIQAVLWAVLLIVLVLAGVQEAFFIRMAQAGILVNLVIAVFNLLPVPPLDGGRVLVGVLPHGPAYQLSRIEPFGFFIVLALLIPGILSAWWISPLVRASYAVLISPLLSVLR